ITKTLERYQHCCYNAQDSNGALSETQSWYQEMSKLRAKFEALQRTQRHLLGEELGPLSVKELQQLEKQLECALSQARQRKTQLMMEQVEELRRKERHLGEMNRQLKHKCPVVLRTVSGAPGCPGRRGHSREFADGVRLKFTGLSGVHRT
ncbi:hypothetical protein ACJX0J_026238, partial [Zea mays]